MKRQMKKKLAVLLSLVLIISLALAGCKKKEEIPEPDKLAEAYYLLFTRGNTEDNGQIWTHRSGSKKGIKHIQNKHEIFLHDICKYCRKYL